MMRSAGFVVAALAIAVAGGRSVLAIDSGGTVARDSQRSAASRLDSLRIEREALLRAIRAASGDGPSPSGSEVLPASVRLTDMAAERTALDAEIVSTRAELQAAPSATGPREPQDPQGLGTLPVVGDSSQITSGNAFNPSLAVILDGVYYRDNPSQGKSRLRSLADGFGSGSGSQSHGGPPAPGFALRESEIAFTGTVDPYFDAVALLSVSQEGVDLEEVYGQTRKLLPGVSLRFGKFFSGFGYENHQHPHQYDFVDQSLPYAMLAGGGLNDTGVRLTLLPKLPFYAQVGVEALQGTNDAMASQLGKEASPVFSEKAGPRLFTAFARVSPNLGFDHALQLGASFARSQQHQTLRSTEPSPTDGASAEPVVDAYQGTANLLGFEVVWKYDSPLPFGRRDFKLQAEYLRLTRNLDLVGTGGEPAASGETLATTEDGLYVQGAYGIASRVAAGLRFDVVGLTNRTTVGGVASSFDDTHRLSASLTFDPTEFSRLRVQYARGSVPVGGRREAYDEFYVQFQLSLGAHGAHSF